MGLPESSRQRVDERRCGEGAVDGAAVDDVDDLNDLHRRRVAAEGGVDVGRDGVVDELHRADARGEDVGDDAIGLRLAGEQEGGDRRRGGEGDLADERVGDDTGTAGHRADEAERVGAAAHGEEGFVDGGDAADLQAGAGHWGWRWVEVHEEGVNASVVVGFHGSLSLPP